MNKKYWLIGAIIGVILSAAAYYYLDNVGDSGIVNIPYLPAIILSIGLFGLDKGSDGVGPFIIFIVYGFVVGAIIAWIYGKLKNRKQIGTIMN
jgi:hypothetical protein